jgi:hypothetical protein
MSDDQITLIEAILFLLFLSSEKKEKMTSKEIYERLSELKWVANLKETDVENQLKNNEKMFKIEGDTYDLSDHGISLAYNVNFY